MFSKIKIFSFFKVPVILGTNTIELFLKILTFTEKITFGNVINWIDNLAQKTHLGFEILTESIIKGSSNTIKESSFSEAITAIYDYILGIDSESLYLDVLKTGNIEALDLLLSQNVTRNQKLLENILVTNHDQAARYLINKGFVNSQIINFDTVLCYSSSNMDANISLLALENGANINVKCWERITHLENAMHSNRLSNVVALTERIEVIPPSILIDYASSFKYLESGVVEYLISQGVKPDYKNDNNSTLFIKATRLGEYKLANFLLDNYKIDVNSDEYWTPLVSSLFACYNNMGYKCSPDLALSNLIIALPPSVKVTFPGLKQLNGAAICISVE
jgi:hypothetical protein